MRARHLRSDALLFVCLAYVITGGVKIEQLPLGLRVQSARSEAMTLW